MQRADTDMELMISDISQSMQVQIKTPGLDLHDPYHLATRLSMKLYKTSITKLQVKICLMQHMQGSTAISNPLNKGFLQVKICLIHITFQYSIVCRPLPVWKLIRWFQEKVNTGVASHRRKHLYQWQLIDVKSARKQNDRHGVIFWLWIPAAWINSTVIMTKSVHFNHLLLA